MGNTRSSRKFLELKRLEEITGIPRNNFSQIHDEFKRKNEDPDEKEVIIDKTDCRHFLNNIGVGADNLKQVDAAFDIFLEDGQMSSEELFSCVVMLSDTMDGVARFQYVVDTHNPKGPDENVITRKYGLKVLRCLKKFFDIKNAPEPAKFWAEMVGENDPKEVTRDQFIKYVSTHAPYQDFLV